MEDKIGLKNSLFADQKDAKQDSPKAFAKKSEELVLQESLKTFSSLHVLKVLSLEKV